MRWLLCLLPPLYMSNGKQSDHLSLKEWIDKRISGLKNISEQNAPETNIPEYLVKTLQTRWGILKNLLPENILLLPFSSAELTWIQISLEENHYSYGTLDMSKGEKTIAEWIESKIPLWVASYILQLSQAKLTHSQN
jgi:hypothetical protein